MNIKGEMHSKLLIKDSKHVNMRGRQVVFDMFWHCWKAFNRNSFDFGDFDLFSSQSIQELSHCYNK